MHLKKNLFIVYLASFIFALSAFFLFQNISFYPFYQKELNLAAVGIYSWIPGIFAFYYAKKEKVHLNFKSTHKASFLFAALMPVIVAFLGALFSLTFAPFSLDRITEATEVYHLCFPFKALNISLFILALYFLSFLTSISFNFFLNLGQELFWRGYLWEQLKSLGFGKRCLFSGILFSIWFSPLIVFFGHNYPFQKFWGVILMIGFSLALTPILSFLKEKEKSVMSSTLFYSMILTFCPIDVVFFPSGNPLLIAPLGISGILSLASIALPIIYKMENKQVKAANI